MGRGNDQEERQSVLRSRICLACGGNQEASSGLFHLNEVFTPDEAAIAHAERILQVFAEADTGLVVVDGKLIEKPVLREMRRILSIAERVSP